MPGRNLLAWWKAALARAGWRLKQTGPGTQIGLVQGNVTIQSPPVPTAGLPPRAAAPTVQDVLTVLSALPPEKRALVEDFAKGQFGSAYVKGMSESQRKRLYGYAYTTLERERAWKR